MSLGTWRFILPGRHDAGKQRLWDEALLKAFPHLRRTPRELERAVEGVYHLRNRIAHLEPIINSNVPAQLVNMRTVIGSIDPKLLSWFTSTERISAALKRRPFPACLHSFHGWSVWPGSAMVRLRIMAGPHNRPGSFSRWAACWVC